MSVCVYCLNKINDDDYPVSLRTVIQSLEPENKKNTFDEPDGTLNQEGEEIKDK